MEMERVYGPGADFALRASESVQDCQNSESLRPVVNGGQPQRSSVLEPFSLKLELRKKIYIQALRFELLEKKTARVLPLPAAPRP